MSTEITAKMAARKRELQDKAIELQEELAEYSDLEQTHIDSTFVSCFCFYWSDRWVCV